MAVSPKQLNSQPQERLASNEAASKRFFGAVYQIGVADWRNAANPATFPNSQAQRHASVPGARRARNETAAEDGEVGSGRGSDLLKGRIAKERGAVRAW
jgi:hypothetical protein